MSLPQYVGSIIFVAANTWVEYKKPGGWPYEFPIENAYVKGKANNVNKDDITLKYIAGICRDVDIHSMKLSIKYDVFDQIVTTNSKYLSKYCYSSIPAGTDVLCKFCYLNLSTCI